MAAFAAALPRYQVGLHGRLQRDGYQSRQRNREPVEDHRRFCLGSPEHGAGEDGDLGPAELRKRAEWLSMKVEVVTPCSVDGRGDDPSFPIEHRGVRTGTKPNDVIGIGAEQRAGERGGDGGVADTDLAEREQALLPKLST